MAQDERSDDARERKQADFGELSRAEAPERPAAAADEAAAAASPSVAWLPQGWVTVVDAARMMGIARPTFRNWVTQGKAPRPRWVAGSDGRHQWAYAVADVEQARAARAAEAEQRVVVPEGFVDVDGACAILNCSPSAMTEWQRDGKIAFARWGRTRDNKRYRLFAVADLERFMQHKRAGTVFVEPGARATSGASRTSPTYHVPDGYVRADQAAKMFGVSRKTLSRWEADGSITCGTAALGAKLKVYPLDALRRLVDECGTFSPPYADPDRPGVWRVPLAGHGMQRREALIDAADVPLVEGKRCHFSAQGRDHESDTVVVVIGDARPSLRTLVMGVSGRGRAVRVSHRNGDALDCRRANLIVRTPQALSRGYGKQSAYGGRPCSSRFKGVCLEKNTGKWVASIVVDYKTIRLGRFRDEIAAAEAYDEAARELFGEHARLNFPDGVDAFLANEADRDTDGTRVAA